MEGYISIQDSIEVFSYLLLMQKWKDYIIDFRNRASFVPLHVGPVQCTCIKLIYTHSTSNFLSKTSQFFILSKCHFPCLKNQFYLNFELVKSVFLVIIKSLTR